MLTISARTICCLLMKLLDLFYQNYCSILSHHCLPLAFTEVIFLPLIKDKNSLADINNYRPIAIVSILGKVFESCVLVIFSNYLDTHFNQFGFVHHGECNKAILALKTVVNYFLNNSSPVFICSLDAEKAFDRINYYSMLSRLIDCKIPKVFIMFFHAWFTSFNFRVCLNCTLSYSVNILSGLLQGNLLSLKIFIVFMDKLVRLDVYSKLGC